jgi:hypothetical protein
MALKFAHADECKLIWLPWRYLPRIRRLLPRRNRRWERYLELIHGRPGKAAMRTRSATSNQ